MPYSTLDRRRFLRAVAACGSGVALAPVGITARTSRGSETESKNDRPRIGAVGLGSQGTGIARQAAQFGDIVAVCDADLQHAERAKAAFGGKPDVYQDYRRLLDRNDIDIVTNGTPDHWHTAINIAHWGMDCEGAGPVSIEARGIFPNPPDPRYFNTADRFFARMSYPTASKCCSSRRSPSG